MHNLLQQQQESYEKSNKTKKIKDAQAKHEE
jgi:hypothetical protein